MQKRKDLKSQISTPCCIQTNVYILYGKLCKLFLHSFKCFESQGATVKASFKASAFNFFHLFSFSWFLQASSIFKLSLFNFVIIEKPNNRSVNIL